MQKPANYCRQGAGGASSDGGAITASWLRSARVKLGKRKIVGAQQDVFSVSFLRRLDQVEAVDKSRVLSIDDLV